RIGPSGGDLVPRTQRSAPPSAWCAAEPGPISPTQKQHGSRLCAAAQERCSASGTRKPHRPFPVLSSPADDATLRGIKTKRDGRNMTTQPLANLADMVRERATRRGNATAYEFEGRITSFAEFDIKTNKVANALV